MAAIVQLYADAGDTTPVLVGERHLPQLGAPARIVLVRAGGKAGGTLRVGDGNIASWGQGFRAYLWGAETVSDLTRYDAADDMLDRFINAVRARVPGRAEITTIDPTDASVQSYGEHLQVLVTYTRSVPRDAAIWAVPVTPISPPNPMQPNGSTGDTFNIDATTERA
jgi:hypothetical protein